MSPPANVTIPRTELPQHIRKAGLAPPSTPATSFMTYTAADLRHLPSITQLSERLDILLSSRKIRVESKAAAILFGHLKRYIVTLLESSVALLSVRHDGSRREVRITTSQIMHVLRANGGLVSVVSPAVLTKYSNV
jgi:hypothetical protein